MRFYLIIALCTIFIFFSASTLVGENKATSFFAEERLKCIVSIEKAITSEDTVKYQPIGTGFLVRSPKNHLLIATAKHVIIDDRGRIHKNLVYRLNDTRGKSIVYPATALKLLLNLDDNWFFSKKKDVACRFVAYSKTADLLYFDSEEDFLESRLVTAGAPVVIPGFPLGLRSEDYAKPIVRRGMVASCDSSNIIIDSFVFPGNSGSPVIYVPPMKVDSKTLGVPFLTKEKIIGLVSYYIPYVDVGYSQQTKRPRISFEENSGLCNVVPAEAILSLLNRADVIEMEQRIDVHMKSIKDSTINYPGSN